MTPGTLRACFLGNQLSQEKEDRSVTGMQGREAVLLAGWPLTCCFYTLPAPFCCLVLSLAPVGALYFSSIPADKLGPLIYWRKEVAKP